MEIKNVELIPEQDTSGMHQPAQFLITWANNNQNYVPIEPLNRHYWEVREWYLNQPKKPFGFAFEPLVPAEE